MSDTGGPRWVSTGSGGINLLAADGSVLLSVSSVGALTFGAAATVTGMVIQSMTSTQRDALSSPTAGTIIYNSTTNKLNVRVAAGWEAVTSA